MVYEFDEFVLDAARVELRHRGEIVHLEPKSFELLLLLVQNTERVVTKDEIFDRIWSGVYVTDASLSGAIKQIRRALGDTGAAQIYVRTIHGKGFRFVGQIAMRGLRPAAAAHPHTGADPHGEAGPPVVAVLPFQLIGTVEAHQAIADAIPAEVISALSRLRAFKVIARGSTFSFQTANVDFDDVRTRLGATYGLSGSVELTDRRLFVIAELIDLRSHQIVWSNRYDGALDGVFEVRQQIVMEITNAVEQRISKNEADRLMHAPSEHLDAWGLYHLGVRHLYRFNGADNGRAAAFFEGAAVRDPNFARAFAGLSYTEFENYNLGFGAQKAQHLARAKRLAEQAVDIDPYDPFCNLVLGRANWIHQDMNEALSWVDRSIQLNPNYAFAHYNSGKLNAINCQGAAADAHVHSAMTLSPIDPHLQSMLSARALAAFVDNDAERAMTYADKSLKAPNAHLYVCVIAAAIHTSYGQHDRAQQARAQIDRLGTPFAKDHFLSLFTLGDPARNAAMLKALDRLQL